MNMYFVKPKGITFSQGLIEGCMCTCESGGASTAADSGFKVGTCGCECDPKDTVNDGVAASVVHF